MYRGLAFGMLSLATIGAYGAYHEGIIDFQNPRPAEESVSTDSWRSPVSFDGEALTATVHRRLPFLKKDVDVESVATTQEVRTAADQLQAKPSPSCPDSPEFQFFIQNDPTSRLCLETTAIKAGVEAKAGYAIMNVVVDPAYKRNIDLATTLESAPPDACKNLSDRLSKYGTSLLRSTGLIPEGHDIVIELTTRLGEDKLLSCGKEG